MTERQQSWSVGEILAWTTARFTQAQIPSARLDAELLLAESLTCSRIDLYTDPERPLAVEERARFRALVKRRLAKVPVAYLVGRREFWSLDLRVTEGVLVPRPDTEALVDEALELVRQSPAPRVLDVGTGSGAVALALKKERPHASVIGSDASKAALVLAAENSRRLGLAVPLVRADCLSAVARKAHFDLIVSNPPYLRPDEITADLAYEPRSALDGGPDGLQVVRRLIEEAPGCLQPGGALAMEIAPDQAEPVAEMFTRSGWQQVRRRRDLGRLERVVSARWPS